MKRRTAFTISETIIVMTILLMIIGMIFFIITFVFQTMYRINFKIETISIFETIQSRLDSVFSMWYKDDSGSQTPQITNALRSIEFPTIKMKENESSWLSAVSAKAKVTFDEGSHEIRLEIDNGSEKTVYQDDYIENIQFGFESQDERTIMATITFTSSNKRFQEIKFTKFRTIN